MVFFSKRTRSKINKGYYILIGFKDLAAQYCIGGFMAKRIMHFYDDNFQFSEDYHPLLLSYYLEQGIPYLDLTRGERYPPECSRSPFAVIDFTEPLLLELREE